MKLFDRVAQVVTSKGKTKYIASDGKQYNEHQFAANHQVKVNRHEERLAWERTAFSHIRYRVDGHAYMTSDGKGFKKLHAAVDHQIKLLQAGPLVHTQIAQERLAQIRGGHYHIHMTAAQLCPDNTKEKAYKRPLQERKHEEEMRKAIQVALHAGKIYNGNRALGQSKEGLNQQNINMQVAQPVSNIQIIKKKKPLPKSKAKGTSKMSAVVKADNDKNRIVVKAYSRNHAARVFSDLSGIPMAHITAINTTKPTGTSKLCSNNDYPSKGTRKWVIKYEIYSYGTKIAVGRNDFMYTNMELVKEGIETKTEAVQLARDLALKEGMPMTVQIVHKLVDASHTVADLEPRMAKGEFTVSYKEQV